MDADEPILPSSSKIKMVTVGIPCLLILYVLSIGPVAKMEDAGLIGGRVGKILQISYTPLQILGSIPGARPVMNWYFFHVWNCDTMGDNTL
jgi:hypothetical protein